MRVGRRLERQGKTCAPRTLTLVLTLNLTLVLALTLTLVLTLTLTLVLTLTRSEAKPICCFNCGGTGHKSKDCPEARDTNQACPQFFSPSPGPGPGPVRGPSPCSTPSPRLNHVFFSPLTL